MTKLDQAHKHFIESLEAENKSSATVIAYKKDIEQLVKHLKEKGLSDVEELALEHLESFMNSLQEKSYTPKSISRKTNATRTFIKYLHTKNHITENIGEKLKHPKVDNKAPRILSRMEYRALRDSAKDDVRSYALIEVMLQTGVTISEIASIEIDHIEYHSEDKGQLFVPGLESKTSRHIPLNKAVIEAIKKYIEHERPRLESAKHLFITKNGNPLLVRNIRSTIDRFFKLAGIEKAKVNDLRHTFVAHQLSNGVSIEHIAKISGHKRTTTTERYLQYIERNGENGKHDLLPL